MKIKLGAVIPTVAWVAYNLYNSGYGETNRHHWREIW